MVFVSAAGKQHSGDFSRLIAQVRGRLGAARQPRVKAEAGEEKEEEPATHSAGNRITHYFPRREKSSGAAGWVTTLRRPISINSPGGY